MKKLCLLFVTVASGVLLQGTSYSLPLPGSPQQAASGSEARTLGQHAPDAAHATSTNIRNRPDGRPQMNSRLRANALVKSRSGAPGKLGKPGLPTALPTHSTRNALLHAANSQPPGSSKTGTAMAARGIQNGKTGVVASVRASTVMRTPPPALNPAVHRIPNAAVIGGPKSVAGLNGTDVKRRP